MKLLLQLMWLQILNTLLVSLLLNVFVEVNCWQQRQHFELQGTNFPVWLLFLVFIIFLLLWMVFVPIICFRLVSFLKPIMAISGLKAFLQLSFAYNMCHCFVKVSCRFGNTRLYVSDNDIHCLSWRFRWWSSCFGWSWSTFWICCYLFCILYQQIV